MPFFEIIGVIFLGLVLGSFATAFSYRIPRDMPMGALQRSQCSSCHKTLGVPDLVPLFSWIFLKGRCRGCKAPIGCRYPLIELATMALCLAFYVVYGLKPESFLIFFLAPVLVGIIDIDLHFKIIPDSLNLSILLTGLASLLVNTMLEGGSVDFFLDRGGAAAGGAILYGGGSWMLRQGAWMALKREAMGLGDVKFYAAAGFWLGMNPDAASLFMVVSGAFGIIVSLIWKKCTGEAEAPFGPSLIIGFISALLFYIPTFINT